MDYANTNNNSFIAANQWTFIENDEKRPDVLLFINGLPVVLMELKSPSREETDASEAYTQIRNYMHSIPSMFIYNAICVMSDLSENRAGTITSGEDRYMEWKTKDGSYENTQFEMCIRDRINSKMIFVGNTAFHLRAMPTMRGSSI